MGKWMIDQVHSTVGFEVKHLMVSKVRGQFDSFSADIKAEDLTDLTNAKIEFRLDVDSINTRDKERDIHLKSPDFFDVENYPVIVFKSTQIIKNGESYDVQGDLTIKDITKPVVFKVDFGGVAIDPFGAEVYGFEAEATINREEFGLVWNAALETGGVLVGKEVKIKAELEVKREEDIALQNAKIKKVSENNKKNLDEISIRNEILQIIAENLSILVAVINSKGHIKYVTPSFGTILSYDTTLSHKKNFMDMIHPDDRDTIRNDIFSVSGRTLKKALNTEFRILHADGHYIDVEAEIKSINERLSTNEDLILVIMQDISDWRQVENTVYQLAFYDSLTKLPNRHSFINQLRNEVIGRKFSKSGLSVLVIDLDDFKQINDQWGHDVDDAILKEVANRICSSIRPNDVVCRLGGDEFGVMLKDVHDNEEIKTIIENLLMQFQRPISKFGYDYQLNCSIGASSFPEHGETPEDLIKNADTALSYVKDNGKNNFKIFDQKMEHQSLERRILENALRQGIKEKQFYLEYQPKIKITTNELLGMEALVRWKHPELGIISPGKFIPLAEETGLIVPLGEWILQEACRQAVAWQEKGYPPLILSVNISVRQLEDKNFIDKVKIILQETGINPIWLEFEITESVFAKVKSTIPSNQGNKGRNRNRCGNY